MIGVYIKNLNIGVVTIEVRTDVFLN